MEDSHLVSLLRTIDTLICLNIIFSIISWSKPNNSSSTSKIKAPSNRPRMGDKNARTSIIGLESKKPLKALIARNRSIDHDMW